MDIWKSDVVLILVYFSYPCFGYTVLIMVEKSLAPDEHFKT